MDFMTDEELDRYLVWIKTKKEKILALEKI